MRWYVMVVAIITVFGVAAHAQEISISMTKAKWSAGQRIEFSLVAIQADPDAPPDELPDHLTCSLESGGKTHTVTARSMPRDQLSGADAMAGVKKVLYTFDAPDGIIGPVQLRITDLRVPTVLFEVVASAEKAPNDSRYPTLDSLFVLYQPYLGDIAAYQPMYFLVGTDPSKSKFQISFKYRFFNPESDFADRHPWVKGFHFGYAQTTLWNLKDDSAPFEDTSYKPELFWISKNLVSSDFALKGLFLQSGFQHESNGRGGDNSRSTNFLYVQPVFVFFSDSNQYGLQVAPKIWTYVNNDDDTNPDLADYRGYFDLDIKFGKAESFVLGSSLRWAEEGASVQLDLSYPLHRFFNALDIYIQAQYANTLAESLIDYRARTHAFRLGFSIVR